MHLVIPKETLPGENRVPIIPDTVKKLCRLGAAVSIESGLGIKSGFTDEEYGEAGAVVSSERSQLILLHINSTLLSMYLFAKKVE